MKKFNNKGFLLVETLVSATFVLTVLIILFLQFKNLIINYNNSYKYNTVENVYTLGSIKNYLINNGNLNEFDFGGESYIKIADENSKTCQNLPENFMNQTFCDILIESSNIKTIIYTDESHFDGLKLNGNSGIKEGMKKFIKQLKSTGKSRIIAEFDNGTFASIVVEQKMAQIENAIFVKSDGNNETGNGTITHPYATIGKAYEVAADNNTIYILDNIIAEDTTQINSDKTVTISSCIPISYHECSIGNANTITRGSSLQNEIIYITSGTLNLNTIIIDGNKIESPRSLIMGNNIDNKTYNISLENTTITNGHSTSANGGAIHIDGTCNLTIDNSKLTYNIANSGGALHIGPLSKVTISGENTEISYNKASNTNGGAVVNLGTLIINGGNISNNSAENYGGAILSKKYQDNQKSTITINGGNIEGNTSIHAGGAIFSGSNSDKETSLLTITNGTIKNNKTTAADDASGGAIYSHGELRMTGGTISNNSAGTWGGGFICKSSCTMTGGSITNNNAVEKNGGGVQNDGTFTMDGATASITNNHSKLAGGGVAIADGVNAKFYMKNGTIINNTADSGKKGVYKGEKGTYTKSGGTVQTD